MSEQVRARDMDAPVKKLTIDGAEYELRFCNEAARVAEDVYDEQYHKDIGYGGILQELARGRYRAMMAVFYGALVAGGSGMSWEKFDAEFRLDSIPGMEEMVLSAVTDSLPEAGEDDQKNA